MEKKGALRLFDSIERSSLRPKKENESNFAYLNQSGRPIAQRIRNLLEQWFDSFPEAGKPELWRRFRAADDTQHLSAFFELYCHALIKAHGYSVKYHPFVGKSKHVDFLVMEKAHKPLFYLECTLAADPSIDRKSKARLAHLIADLNDKLHSPNFFIEIYIKAIGKASAPSSKIRSFLEQKLSAFDPDIVAQRIRRYGWKGWPCLSWQENGWDLEFYLLPKRKEARGRKDLRPIGGIITSLEKIDSRKPLLNALKAKAARYGKLDLPFVIAVDSLDMSLEDYDIMQALFGTLQYHINLQTKKHWVSRQPDGFWYGPPGPQNRRVSAVLIAVNLTPWTVTRQDPVIWHNPFAKRPLDPRVWKGPQVVPNWETSRMEPIEGLSSFELLNLLDR